GNYFITAWADPYGSVLQETLNTNVNPNDSHELGAEHFSSTPLTVLQAPPADLIVTNVTPDATGTGGTPFVVSWTVKNRGVGATAPPFWFDGVYASTLPDINDPNAKVWNMGIFFHSGALNSGDSYTSRQTITLSPPISAQYIVIQ